MNGNGRPSIEQLTILSNILRDIARSHRLSRDDMEDFAQAVHLKLVERGYDIFDRFEGRSSLKTYLFSVVRHMLLDWCNSKYGKWRPSTAALRLGQHAINLERLITRDGYTSDEAVTLLCTRAASPGACELRRLLDSLPVRRGGRPIETDIPSEANLPVEFDDPIAADDVLKARALIRSKLAVALAALPAADQRLISLRYRHDHSVQSVARLLEANPKVLYRRLERVLRSLRSHLNRQGIHGSCSVDYRSRNRNRPPSARSGNVCSRPSL